MNKSVVVITTLLVVVLAITAVIYVYRAPIMIRVIEHKMPGYINDICECDEVIENMESFSSVIVDKWDLIEKEDKLYILKSMQSIRSARKRAILEGDPGITYEEIEQMVDNAKKISQKY